jgi:dolichol-phosphate mannosyltransferase
MISIIIPVYNEDESIVILHGEIINVAQLHHLDVEILFVDDGSKDNSWDKICELSAAHLNTRGIKFRRNFGKAAALSAGFQAANGDIFITMDADLQDDPMEIPNFLKQLEQGGPAKNGQPFTPLDVISGWKKVRLDPWHKTFPSKIFNKMVSNLTDVHLNDHNCGMKCYRAPIFKEVRLYGELHRFIPVLAAARGFKVGELAIQHRARKFGYSKYGVRRFIKGFLDLLTVKFLTGFGQRPQHLLGGAGLLSFLAGSLGLGYLAITWIIRLWEPDLFPPLHDRPLLIYAAAFLLLGAQMMSIGFLAELITAFQGKDADTYSISDTTPVQKNI